MMYQLLISYNNLPVGAVAVGSVVVVGPDGVVVGPAVVGPDGVVVGPGVVVVPLS